jgi:propionyl-CoA carboxylase alpha chain
MFKKILIANRGEIALRIAKTARKMGIGTVAVYSDADKYGLHVTGCDEAVHIGPPPASQSYLVMDRVIEACKQTGADAVHPGYGFLSENSKFAKAVSEAGITFIGPRPDVIELMGDKMAAIGAAQKAGTPTVPGLWEAIPDADRAVAAAPEIGYPIMLKAAAGGGGKGMRVARDDAELRDAYRLATSEARGAFGDDRVFMEKFIEQPRHIEIQVLGDTYGNVVHLGERECSIQRRHQKVIEEAPSPFVDEQMRQAMGGAAVALAKTVGYSSAGTVEFIVDRQGNFYFLEMNTRLQVEHSVTEFVQGIDLVEWMIRVAAGDILTIRQEDAKPRGWAIESRVYAEDPDKGFLPSTGRLIRYRTPEETPNVRVDNGVQEGGEISMFYDPMIAKVTVWERDRDRAVALMRRALDEVYITGVRHNIAFLTALMANKRFLTGDISTNFIAEEYPEGFVPAPLEKEDVRDIVAVSILMHLRYVHRASLISDQMDGYGRHIPEDYVVVVNGEYHPLRVVPVGALGAEEGCDIDLNGNILAIRSTWQIGEPVLRCNINAYPRRFKVERNRLGYKIYHLGAEVEVNVYRAEVAQMAKRMPKRKALDMSQFLVSPMPGLLRSVAVAEGEKVSPGDELAVVEAMKMENLLKSQRAGRIAKVHAEPGSSLKVGEIILEFEAEPKAEEKAAAS